MGTGLRSCLSSKLLGNGDAAGLRTTLRVTKTQQGLEIMLSLTLSSKKVGHTAPSVATKSPVPSTLAVDTLSG